MNIAEKKNKKILRFQRCGFLLLKGWCRYIDASMVRTLLTGQTKQGISGSVAEIGIWHGKSFFLLVFGCNAEEQALAIDIRDEPLIANCRRFNIPVTAYKIIKNSSSLLTASDIVNSVGKLRFIHIDGGHGYEDVINDLNLAEAASIPQAVFALDDVFNSSWPEVGVATFDWLRQHKQFLPLAVSKGKLYACRNEYIDLYKMMLLQYMQKRYLRHMTRISVFGQEALCFYASSTENVLDAALQRLLGRY